MGSPGKPPIFDGTDYDYWKVRMRAYLLSLGSEAVSYTHLTLPTIA